MEESKLKFAEMETKLVKKQKKLKQKQREQDNLKNVIHKKTEQLK